MPTPEQILCSISRQLDKAKTLQKVQQTTTATTVSTSNNIVITAGAVHASDVTLPDPTTLESINRGKVTVTNYSGAIQGVKSVLANALKTSSGALVNIHDVANNGRAVFQSNGTVWVLVG